MQAVWVEIPVSDMDRAAQFYQQVFGIPALEIVDEGVRRTATVAHTNPGISLNQTANFTPGAQGVLVYIQMGADEPDPLAQAETAGGKVITSRTAMGTAGDYALLQDTEGNNLAIYYLPDATTGESETAASDV